MNTPIISIVTPIYSRPELIAQGLDSIFSQDIRTEDFEVLAVNNGAIDPKVAEILDSYTYNGIRPVNLNIVNVKVNKRAGSGRNAGIKSAKGKFILHKDHDDCFVKGSLKLIIDELNKNPDLDLLMYDYETRLYGSNRLIASAGYAQNSQDVMTGDEFLLSQPAPNYMWHTAYNRQFALQNNLFLEEGTLIEDMDYVLQSFTLAKKVKYTPIIALCYYKFGAQGGNVTNSVLEYNYIFVNGFLSLIERIYDKGIRALNQGHSGGRTLVGIYHFYYKDTLKRQMWQLPYKDIIKCIKEHPVKQTGLHKFNDWASNHPTAYAISAKAIAPFYKLLLKVYRKINKIDY